ncbi:MAG: response regulator transcription factor [Chitinophagaceae bacterium]|nr:MAG: response regulator transcription factor [Chitinophagaceae bacterium]
MNIIIIEDELKAAKSLASLINKIKPDAIITAQLQGIEDAVDHLIHNKEPGLIFMDIQLSDGLCFEIFKAVKIHCPVIFCTAYGEYAMDAIKANGVDYIVKPFSKEELQEAFEKVENFKNFFQQNTQPNLDELLRTIGLDGGKKSFLISQNNKYITVLTEQIAFIYIKFTSPSIRTFEGEEYYISQSLDYVQNQLSDKQFFRLNRQYLINFSAIKEVEHYFNRKLLVRLVVPCPDELLVGKEKSTAFLQWLENR